MKILHGYSNFNSPSYLDAKIGWRKILAFRGMLASMLKDFTCPLIRLLDPILRALDWKDVLLDASGINLHSDVAKLLTVFAFFKCINYRAN